MSKVLRAFDYSFDGVTALHAKVDDDIDFRGMTDGLAAEGYIGAGEPVVAPAIAPVVEPAVEPTVESVVTPVVEPVIEPVVESSAPTQTRKRR